MKAFSQMRLFRSNYPLTLDRLTEAANHLPANGHVNLLPNQAIGHGFESVTDLDDGIVHVVMLTQERLLPKKVIKPRVLNKIVEFESNNGHPPGRKAIREIEEAIVAYMLPKAPVFHTRTHALIRGTTVVIGASKPKAATFLAVLTNALFATSPDDEPALKCLPVSVVEDISERMKAWIHNGSFWMSDSDEVDSAEYLPDAFELGSGFKSEGSERSVISGKGVNLSDSEIERVIARVTELELVFQGTPFCLTDEFAVKGMKYKAEGDEAAEFLTSRHVFALWSELAEAFGGEKCN